jgi:hypothetical protein
MIMRTLSCEFHSQTRISHNKNEFPPPEKIIVMGHSERMLIFEKSVSLGF